MKMKRMLAVLLLLAMLMTGCQRQAADHAPATTLPSSTETQPMEPTPTQPTETEPTQPTETEPTQPPEPVWTGYESPKAEYVYFHDSGRELEWEEDILYFANNLMREHPVVLDENWIVQLPGYGSTGENFYEPQVKEEMLRQINDLIPRLEELTDDEILYSLKRIIALFHDVHTRVEYHVEEYFPIVFMPIREEAGWVFYVVSLEKDKEDLLYTKLAAINGYSVEEVMDKIRPFVPCETEYVLIHSLAGAGLASHEYLCARGMLVAAGVIAEEDSQTVYTLTDAEGNTHDLSLEAEGSLPPGMVGKWGEEVYTVPMAGWHEKNYWFTEALAEDTLYVRFNSFSVQPDYTYLQLSADIRRAYSARGSYDKVIVDLRFNGGGYIHSGYEGLITLFGSIQCEEFYVLINGTSYSQSIIFAAELLHVRGDKAKLVGEPSGEAGGFFASIWTGEYVMPNCQVEFTIPTVYFLMFPTEDGNVIHPDITLYPTMEDYISGVDTVLQYLFSL